MEINRQDDALYIVHHQVTEASLLHMEKGIRARGFQASGKKVMKFFLVSSLGCLVLKNILSGMPSDILGAVGGALFLAFLAGAYILVSGWAASKKEIKAKFKAEQQQGADLAYDYRFYEDCYEVVGAREHARVEYTNVWRLIDMSGQILLAEKGDVIRDFMANEMKKGEAADLVAFLERKCGTQLERVSVK